MILGHCHGRIALRDWLIYSVDDAADEVLPEQRREILFGMGVDRDQRPHQPADRRLLLAPQVFGLSDAHGGETQAVAGLQAADF